MIHAAVLAAHAGAVDNGLVMTRGPRVVALTVIAAASAALGCGARTELESLRGAAGQAGAPTTSTSSGGREPDCGPLDLEPVVVGEDCHGASGIATDATHVYFTESYIGGSRLMRWPKNGGPLEVDGHWLGSSYGADAIAVDDTYVYSLGYFGFEHGLDRRPKTGGPIEPMASVGGVQNDLVLDGTDLFGLAGGSGPDATDGIVFRFSTLDGALEELAAGIGVSAGWLALSRDDVYWTQHGAMGATGSVHRVPRFGGSPSVIVDHTNVWAVAVVGSSLYWAAPPDASDPYPTAIWRSALDGTGASVVATGAEFVLQLVGHGGCLYLLDWASIGRIPLDGGEIAPLTPPISQPYAMAVDSDGIYWTDYLAERLIAAAW